jgi:nidogen (entactin)
MGFTGACWCVNPDTGVMVEGTLRMPEEMESAPIDCDNVDQPPIQYTQCQKDRWTAEKNDDEYVPQCTEAGAYEPVQRHPDGSITCVDFNGEEFTSDQAECMSKCQLQAYYAETENIFLHFDNLVPKCEDNGDYSPVQCDLSSGSCFCVNSDGVEKSGTRRQTTDRNSLHRLCSGSPQHAPSGPGPESLVFTQGSGIHQVELPLVANESQAVRLWNRQGHAFVGVAFDCNTQNVFWTDVSGRSIYSAPIDNMDEKHYVVRTGLRSPEGIVVDYTSGNIYWTDSGTDRIEVSAADGSKRMVIVSEGLTNPRGIALDSYQGKLYWSDWNRNKPRIMQSDMDGSNVNVFVEDDLKLPNDIAFNAYTGQLCFIDSGTKKLECIDSDGENRQVVHDLSSSGQPKLPFGLTAYGDMYYYTDRRTGRLHSVNSATDEDVSISGPVGVHGHMFGVTFVRSQCPRQVRNACSNNNGGCADSELCLPTPTGHTCRCPPDTDCSNN